MWGGRANLRRSAETFLNSKCCLACFRPPFKLHSRRESGDLSDRRRRRRMLAKIAATLRFSPLFTIFGGGGVGVGWSWIVVQVLYCTPTRVPFITPKLHSHCLLRRATSSIYAVNGNCCKERMKKRVAVGKRMGSSFPSSPLSLYNFAEMYHQVCKSRTLTILTFISTNLLRHEKYIFSTVHRKYP